MTDPILYIEDGPDDVFFMQRTFKKVNPSVQLQVITNGEDAIRYFDGTNPENGSVTLSLVILDLNLPGRSGVEVLTQIRAKSKFPKVPVILFSASSQQSDIDACYHAGCNAYVVKPNDPLKLKALVEVINQFWLNENYYSKTPGAVAIVGS